VYIHIYIYLAYLLPNSSCYTLCSLVPQTTVFTTFSERYAIRKPLYIRTYFLFVRELELFRRLRSTATTIARNRTATRETTSRIGMARYRSFSVERGVHNPTHDGLLGTAPRLIMHRSASFSFRRYC